MYTIIFFYKKIQFIIRKGGQMVTDGKSIVNISR